MSFFFHVQSSEMKGCFIFVVLRSTQPLFHILVAVNLKNIVLDKRSFIQRLQKMNSFVCLFILDSEVSMGLIALNPD